MGAQLPLPVLPFFSLLSCFVPLFLLPAFKVIGSNIEIAITPPRIARLRSKYGTEFHHLTGDTMQMFNVKGQRSRSRGHRLRSKRKVMYQQQNAIIRQWIASATSNLAWRRTVVIKAEKDCRPGVGQPQVAMHSQMPRFLVCATLMWVTG